jgi:hypothetical protein
MAKTQSVGFDGSGQPEAKHEGSELNADRGGPALGDASVLHGPTACLKIDPGSPDRQLFKHRHFTINGCECNRLP